MAPKRLNVLVYSGNGSTVESVRHCLYTLRRLLSPNYAVISITDSVILKEPWTPSCALLVFPGGADLGYCRSLNGEGNDRISQFVRRGGAYLGFCAGGYYGSERCEFEVGDKQMEVVGSRELAFFPGTCRGCAFKGFKYHSEAGARAVDLRVDKECFGGGIVPTSFRSYYNGGGVFVDAAKFKNEGVEVLANYTEPMDTDGGMEGLGAAAVIYRKVGDGGVILTGPHPEFAAVNLDRNSGGPGYSKVVDAVEEDDEGRTNFLKGCLSKLGLTVSQETSPIPSLSSLHLSSMNHIEVSELLEDLKDVITIEDGEEYIKAENDTFHIEKHSSRWSLNSLVKALPVLGAGEAEEQVTLPQVDGGSQDKIVDYNAIIKRIIPHESEWPGSKETPYFNHHAFFAHLRRLQQEKDIDAEVFGHVLMYGEVVTSTNTILEKNTKLLSHLPHGFTAVATTQVAGRGRGSNVWVSPAGSLIMSTVITHPLHLSNTAPVVFVQYLAAMAVVEAIKTYDKGPFADLPVKLKWPNDIYALDPTKPPHLKEYVKIGGILVNSSYNPAASAYTLTVGIGLNGLNPAPTTSLATLLSALLSSSSSSPTQPRSPNNHYPASYFSPTPSFALEPLLARLLITLQSLYTHFCASGFSPALQRQYHDAWLHTNQIITLEAEGSARARVLGITSDWGMLEVEELGWEDRPTGRKWELQSDFNSFDFWRGLVRRKI